MRARGLGLSMDQHWNRRRCGETGSAARGGISCRSSAVFAIGLALAISSFVAVRGHYQSLDQQQFRRNATYYSTSFKDDVARHVTSLAAIRAFVSASKSVTRWEFSTYAAADPAAESGLPGGAVGAQRFAASASSLMKPACRRMGFMAWASAN